jgi:hypothetical protein
MNSRLSFRSTSLIVPASLTLLAAGTAPLFAQVKLPPLQIEESEEAGNFLRLGARVQFNVKAKVGPGAQTPQQPGFYDNGFVQPDVGGTASGLTWNWGYDDAAQVSGDFIDYDRYSNLPQPGTFKSGSDDTMFGGELLGGVEFGRFSVGVREFRWGAELGYAFTPFSVRHAATASGTVNYLSARHALGRFVSSTPAPPAPTPASTLTEVNRNAPITPPAAPYQGTFNGPGPLIDLNPASVTEITSAATSTFDGQLDADLHTMKIGLWLETDLSPKVSAAFSLGYSSVLADTRFRFTETTTIANGGVPALAPVNASLRTDEWQSGAYAQLRATWQFSRHLGAFASGDYAYHESLRFSGAGRDVSLEFKHTYGASAGFSFSW